MANQDNLALVVVDDAPNTSSVGGSSDPNQSTPSQKRTRQTVDKNKEKEADTVRYTVIDIAEGIDIVQAIYQCVYGHGIGVSIKSGTGKVTSFKFVHWPDVSVEKFDILTVSGNFLMPTMSGEAVQAYGPGEWSVKVPHLKMMVLDSAGNIHSGIVDGACKAAGSVRLAGVQFKRPAYYSVSFQGSA